MSYGLPPSPKTNVFGLPSGVNGSRIFGLPSNRRSSGLNNSNCKFFLKFENNFANAARGKTFANETPTIVGTTAFERSPYGGALLLNGSNYVSFPVKSPNFSLETFKEFTIMFWLYLSSANPTTGYGIYSFVDGGYYGTQAMTLSGDANNKIWIKHNDTASGTIYPTLNTWNHIAILLKNDLSFCVAINGVLTAWNAAANINAIQSLMIGRCSFFATPMIGKIAQFSIHSKCLYKANFVPRKLL